MLPAWPEKARRRLAPRAQSPSGPCQLCSTGFADPMSCPDVSAHQRGGLALGRSRRPRTVWMQKSRSGRKKMGNCKFLFCSQNSKPHNTGGFPARAITHAWYMPPPSCTSTSLTLTAPRFSGTLPSRLSRGCEHPVTPSYYQP